MIHIGQTVLHARREKGITQEQLATAIGVSAAAVSKWETGQSYPDIALLPPLARYFGISVDALMAYAPALTEDEAQARVSEAKKRFETDGWAAGLAACGALAREYPRDAMLRMSMAGALMECLVFAPDEAAREEGRLCQIQWLREAMDAAQGNPRLMAQYLLGVFSMNMKRLDEAEEALTPLVDLPDANRLMPTLRMLQGRNEEAMELAQRNLFGGLNDVVQSLGTMVSLAIKMDDVERAEIYLAITEKIVELIGKGGSLFDMSVAQNALILAKAKGDDDALLDATEAYMDAVLNPHHHAGGPCFDRMGWTDAPAEPAARDRKMAQMLAEGLRTGEDYARLRHTPRVKALLARLDGIGD